MGHRRWQYWGRGDREWKLRIMKSQGEGMKRLRYRECSLFFCLVFILAILPDK